MKAGDYVGTALTFWKQVGGNLWNHRMTVTTWCVECGATCKATIRQGRRAEQTMLHEHWCSVDMRNIRQTVGGTRR